MLSKPTSGLRSCVCERAVAQAPQPVPAQHAPRLQPHPQRQGGPSQGTRWSVGFCWIFDMHRFRTRQKGVSFLFRNRYRPNKTRAAFSRRETSKFSTFFLKTGSPTCYRRRAPTTRPPTSTTYIATHGFFIICHRLISRGTSVVRLPTPLFQEIFGSYGKVTSVDLAVDKRVNLPKVQRFFPTSYCGDISSGNKNSKSVLLYIVFEHFSSVWAWKESGSSRPQLSGYL